MEWLVDIEDGLDVIVARIQIREGAARVAESSGIDDDGVAGREVLDVDAEALRGEIVLRKLHARLVLVILREDEDQMSIEARCDGDCDFEPLAKTEGRGGKQQSSGQGGEGFHAVSRSRCNSESLAFRGLAGRCGWF